MNTLAEDLANYEVLQVKISWKTYSVKHSECLRHVKKFVTCTLLCSSFTHLKPLSGSQNQIVPCGPLFFTFSTSVFANSIVLGGTKLLKLLVGSGNPWSCTIASVQLKYFKIDIDIFQYISANEFYHVRLSLTG